MASEAAEAPKAVRNQEIAELLAGGMTQAKAAELTGTSERTVRRLVSEPEFQSMLQRARRARVAEINQRIPGLLEEALQTLTDLMRNSESDSTRLGAVKTVLSLSDRLETEEIVERVAKLEKSVLSDAGAWTPDVLPGEGADDDLGR